MVFFNVGPRKMVLGATADGDEVKSPGKAVRFKPGKELQSHRLDKDRLRATPTHSRGQATKDLRDYCFHAGTPPVSTQGIPRF